MTYENNCYSDNRYLRVYDEIMRQDRARDQSLGFSSTIHHNNKTKMNDSLIACIKKHNYIIITIMYNYI